MEEKENFKNSLQPRTTNLRGSLDYSRSQAAQAHASRKRKINDLSFHFIEALCESGRDLLTKAVLGYTPIVG